MIVPWVFNSNDEPIALDLEPLVYDEWTPSAPGIAGLTPIIERAGSLLDGRPRHAHTRKPFSPTDAVMDIELDDGRSAFVRTLVFGDEDPAKARWECTRLLAEHSILLWFEANAPVVPVPRVLAFDEANGTLITTLLPGLNALHAYPHLEPAARAIISWAHISVRLFRLSAPQHPFGPIQNSTLPPSYHSISPEHTFTIAENLTLLTFFTNAIAARRTRSASINNADAQEALSRRLDRLLTRLKPLLALAEDTPVLTRFVLTHRDPRASNVLLHETSGEVLGIVDWEFNAAMPACMAVAYPDWIRYSIIESPLYRNPAASQFETVYVETRERRNFLCDLYERIVRELDEEYYRCLIFGIRLRDALAWIENSYSDHDGFAMEHWVEDHLLVQPEVDHRYLDSVKNMTKVHAYLTRLIVDSPYRREQPAAQAAESFAYAKKLSPPSVFNHLLRCFYFSLVLLHTGFPSATPGVAQIGSSELSLRLYHTTLLHDLGLSNSTPTATHPAHDMSFELHGAVMAYEHLHVAAPVLNPEQVGDIAESIALHTSQWAFGNSSATQFLMSVTSMFDVGGFDGAGIAGLDFKRLWHPRTVAEIESAYPRGDFYTVAIASLDKEFAAKPNCLLSHGPDGLDALVKNFLMGPIVLGAAKKAV
ncbi:hypothetical protein C8R46DRAFT_1318151 [Mycena filopes]|nr:hypothetical protein C8R46DRAFT_1318151 [Mycena filopes]